MSALLALLCALGCAPAVEDRWSVAYTRCDPPEPLVREPAEAAHTPLPAACADALAADLGLPPDFEEPTLRVLLVEAAYQLLARDLGELDALGPTEHVRAPLIEALHEQAALQGHTAVRALLYNQLADAVRRTQAAERGGALAFQRLTGTLAIDPALAEVPAEQRSGAAWASVLVHEAAHELTPPHEPCPDGAPDGCDGGWWGAYGFQAGVLALQLERCDPALEPTSCAALAAYLPEVRARVLAP